LPLILFIGKNRQTFFDKQGEARRVVCTRKGVGCSCLSSLLGLLGGLPPIRDERKKTNSSYPFFILWYTLATQYEAKCADKGAKTRGSPHNSTAIQATLAKFTDGPISIANCSSKYPKPLTSTSSLSTPAT